MSLLSRTKAPTNEVAVPEAPAAEKPTKSKLGLTMPTKRSAPPAFATSPRADLLPPEIGENQRKRAVRRGLRFMVIAVLAATLIASGGAFYMSVAAGMSLVRAEQDTQMLNAERLNYIDVGNTLQGISQGQAAVFVGGSTDIDWDAYLRDLQSRLPDGVELTAVSVDAAGAVEAFEQSEIPLEQPRIATIVFSAETTTLPSVPSWINGLTDMKGFADATPGSLSFSDGVYTSTVTMHVNAGAFSLKYLLPSEEAAE